MKNYRDFIVREFQDRSAFNPMYSMRSFARDLGIAPSTLSEVLNKKKGISVKKAKLVAERLHLLDWQVQYFCDLVVVEHGKSAIQRNIAIERIKEKAQENFVKTLNEESMRLLCSWVEVTILELTYLDDFEPSAEWIAGKLGISLDCSKTAISYLTQSLIEVEFS